MTDCEIIGRLINEGMQAGRIKNCSHQSNDNINTLSPRNDSLSLDFTFQRDTGVAVSPSLEEMRAQIEGFL